MIDKLTFTEQDQAEEWIKSAMQALKENTQTWD
jgi:hypothetical protein